MTDLKSNEFKLNAIEMKEITSKLKDVVTAYAKLDDNMQYSPEGIKLCQDFFMLTNMLLDLPDNRGAIAVTNLMEEFLRKKDMASFDILHNTMVELMSSGYTDDEASTPYTLVWLAATSFRDNDKFVLDGFESIIQAAFFNAQVTHSMDDVILVPQALPSGFQEKIEIKEVYDFVSNHFAKVGSAQFSQEILDKCGQKEMMQEACPTFYLPLFVKGVYDDVIEEIYEKSEELSDQLAENAKLILNSEEVVFHTPVDWINASKENASKLLNSGKVSAFFTMIASQNNPSTEICVLRVANEDNSYVLMYLDKSESSVRSILVVEDEDSYSDFMAEVIEILQENNFPLLLAESKITRKLLNELIESCNPDNEEPISEKGQDSLIRLFNSSMNVDRNEIYQMLTCSTLTVH